jgi:peroxiredoxin
MKLLWNLALLLTASVAAANPSENAANVGKKIDDFRLRDYRGADKALKDLAGSQLVVVAFMGGECPLAKQYGPRLAALAREFEPKGVAFLGIDANHQDSITAIAQYAKTAGITFPILKDVKHAVADQFGALRTPEVFVLDRDRVIRYRGRIDDQYGIGFVRPKPTRRDLAIALDELLAGKDVSQATTAVAGCFIGRVRPEVKSREITYSKHIAPILQKHCVECHREGEIAPFALTSYDEVIGWTDTIREVLQQGRMPPWQANPLYGKFVNDCRVPDEDKQLIYRWIDEGAPEGNPKDLPKPAPFVKGWRIPKPDLVLTVPKPYRVPAQGVIEYQWFVIDPAFKEDKWLRATEVRPGCRSVVHHVLVFAQAPGEGIERFTGFAAGWIAGTVPGARPIVLPEGEALFVRAGSRFLLQVHYTPNGAEQVDQTSIGLVFADPKTVKKEVSVEMVVNPRFAIPPGDGNYRVDARQHFNQDSILLDMSPHTHLRGKAFRYEAIYPDGTQEILLDVPHYDFNWQNTYTLVTPKLLPKGTVLHCTAYYDNSGNNPSNPDPTATVRWGEQTFDEMMIGYFTMMPADQDLRKQPRPATKLPPPPKPVDPELKRLAAHALESQKAFDEFAAAVHKALPQVDRVCVTTISNSNLKVEKASYPGRSTLPIATTGFEKHSRSYALGFYALMGRFIYEPDLSQARGMDMLLLGKTLSSSAHVPVAWEGMPGTVNFWSKDKKAFPKETHETLQALADAVVQRP